jgi:F0F1-type ATP synthase membrane subunit c/vacuolar-type H+-ATPase subunit K
MISIAGSGVGIGILFVGFLNALSNRPDLEEKLFGYLILGFALTEAVALLGLMVSMVILFSK